MREILFKAKRKENGEWVEGLLTKMWGQYHIINPEDENTAYLIDEETICQYTGMTDKNGKKIWENDIVRDCDCDEAYSVKYFSHIGYPAFDCYPEIPCDCNGLSYLIGTGFCEVIGNIFDHAELLEG